MTISPAAMTRLYDVAFMRDYWGTEYLVIIHRVEDDRVCVFQVMKNGDHCGLFRRVLPTELYGHHTAELLA